MRFALLVLALVVVVAVSLLATGSPVRSPSPLRLRPAGTVAALFSLAPAAAHRAWGRR